MTQGNEYQSRIKTLLTEYPSDYIIYVPGAGGEFLSSLISKYSNRYDEIMFQQQMSNRWVAHHSVLINNVCASFSDFTYSNLDDAIHKSMDIISASGLDLNTVVLEAEDLFKQRTKKNLFKLHLTNNSFLTKENSFLLNLNSNWLKHSALLYFLKVYNFHIAKFDEQINIKINRLKYIKNSESNLDQMLEFLKTSDIDHITLAHIEIAGEEKSEIGDLDMNTFLKLSPKEIYDQYSHILFKYHYDPTSYLEWQNSIASRTDVIDYDKIFTKGYLEEMFDIHSDDFHTELMQWHEDNLALIKDSGIDFN